MKVWPEFNDYGDLPTEIHRATLSEIVHRFGGTARRAVIVQRLQRICHLAASSGHLARFVIFGSFVTSKPDPNDVDIFLLMEDSFDMRAVSPESRPVFDHAAAQNLLGASVFWVRRAAAFGGEEAMVSYWQIKRDGNKRGILEVVEHD